MRTMTILAAALLAACGDDGSSGPVTWTVEGARAQGDCTGAPDSIDLVVNDVEGDATVIGYEEYDCDPLAVTGEDIGMPAWVLNCENAARDQINFYVDQSDMTGSVVIGYDAEGCFDEYDISVVVE